jgi:hypothetical protein
MMPALTKDQTPTRLGEPRTFPPGESGLESALAAWQLARLRLERLDPRALDPEQRDAYYRLVARIGLWADARTWGDRSEVDDWEQDELAPEEAMEQRG